jgi:hypothetical protein
MLETLLRFRPLRLLIALVVCASVSGCFDIEQSLRIRGDRFTYETVVRIDARLVAMSDSSSKLNCEKLALSQTERSSSIKITSKESNDGANLVCQLSIEGPITAAALADFPARLELSPRSEDHPIFGKNGAMAFTVEKIARNRYRLTSSMSLADKRPEGGARSSSERLGEQFAMMLMSGRNLRWTVESEKIFSSNGQIAATSQEVKWEAPVATAIRTPQTFTAEFSIPLPWYLRFWYGILDSLDRLMGK